MAAKNGDHKAQTAKLIVIKPAVRVSTFLLALSFSAMIKMADMLMMALKKWPEARVLIKPFLPLGNLRTLLCLDGAAIRLKKLTALSMVKS